VVAAVQICTDATERKQAEEEIKKLNRELERRVADLETLVDRLELNEKLTLVGHDWGGMIGLAWAVDNIEKIDKIIITNTSGFFLPENKKFPFLLWMIKYLPFFSVPAVLGLNLFARGALYLATKKPLDPRVKKGLIEPYNSWKNRIATLKFVRDIPISEKDESHAIVDHTDKHLCRLESADLMFLWGAGDFVFDLHFLDEFKKRFPAAPCHVFHDAGHYLFEDKPEETACLIEKFLNEKSESGL
jgi:haloalkane dehalogenase